MPVSFPNVDPNFFFNNVGPYPGSSAFADALKYYQQNLVQNDAGGGQAQLAAGRAAAGPAQAYQGAKAAPQGAGDAYAAKSFADLIGGQTAARGEGRKVQSETRNADVGGAGDVAGAYGNSMTGAIRAKLATDQANQANQQGILGDVMSGVDIAAGIGSEIVAPGNPMGIGLTMNGIGGFTGGKGGTGGFGGGGFGGGGFGGSPFGAMMGGGGTPSPPGYTPANANTFSPSSLPSWLDPSQISSFSGTGAASPGMFSSLPFFGGP